MPISVSPSWSSNVQVRVRVVVVTGLDGDNCKLVTDGALFAGGGTSGTVTVVVAQLSPDVPPLPFAALPAMSNVTKPEPEDGAVHSKLQDL